MTTVESRQKVLDALTVEFDQLRFTERSTEAGVAVTVDGSGELHQILIEDAVLAGPDPQRIGPAVLTALGRARLAATGHRQARINETLGGPA